MPQHAQPAWAVLTTDPDGRPAFLTSAVGIVVTADRKQAAAALK